jgi:hypothetical protein
MTRDEASAERDRLVAEQPDAIWLLRKRGPGDWTVVRASVDGLPERPAGDVTTELRAPPEPPRPDEDRRPLVDPLWGGPA